MIIAEGNIILADGSSFALNKNHFLSFDIGVTGREDFSRPSYGIFSSVGNIKLKDYDSSLMHLIDKQQIKENTNINLWFKNPLLGIETRKIEKTVSKIEYFYESKELNLTLADNLASLQNSEFAEYGRTNMETITSIFLSFRVKDYLEDFKLGNTFVSFEDDTEIKIPYIAKGSVWNALSNICEVSQKYIFQDFDGLLQIIGE